MLKRPHILVVGSFMMDLIATTERAPGPGETVAGTGFRTVSGGKGANQAVQCARLGAHVTMAGRVGDDAFGREALQSVRTAGVDLSRVTADPSAPTGVAHILVEDTPQGVQNRITIVPGANFTLTPADLAWMEDGVRAFDMVLLQFELPMDVVEAAAGWAHAAGVPVMVNPAPAAPISDRLLACADYLSPNEHEAVLLSGLPLRAGPAGVEAADPGREGAPGHPGGERRGPGRNGGDAPRPLRPHGAGGRPHRGGGFLCGRLLHRPVRRAGTGSGPGLCQPYRGPHRLPHGGPA